MRKIPNVSLPVWISPKGTWGRVDLDLPSVLHKAVYTSRKRNFGRMENLL